jgi:beta-glucosidase
VAMAVVAVAAPCGSTSAAGRCGDPAARPWCDTSLSPSARAELLLSELTDAEKIGLLGGDDIAGATGAEGTHTGTSAGIPRVGLPSIYLSDGPAGPRSGEATAMPSPLALAATWDPRLAAMHAAVIADEVRKKGNDIVFAPTVDIARNPLAGRTFETYGEDPLLASRLAVQWIRSAQRKGVIATVKHYAGNNQEGTGPLANEARPGATLQGLGILATEGSRMQINAVVDERTMHELYLPMFEAAVKEAHVGTVMCAYNRFNGPYACENEPLLEQILRDDWGFRGFTIADYGGAHDTAASLRTGLDFEPWPGLVYSPLLVNAAIAGGAAAMADVDEHVRRYLRTLFAYGALDRGSYIPDESAIDRGAHARTARRIAEAGITLLRNDGLLPLRARRLDSIAVIGAGATKFVTGGGSSEIDPYSYVTPADAIADRAGGRVAVSADDGSDLERAVALARDADVAVLVVPSYSTEGVDRTCLSLECPPAWGDQDALIEAVAAANRRTVVVIESGGPVLTPWRHEVGAVLAAWYPGSAGGAALARILFGDIDAQGRLPITFPEREEDLPTAGDPRAYPGVEDAVVYDEGIFVGYRHYQASRIEPAYAFGEGLSYTRFRFSGLRVQGGGPGRADVSVRVVNVGERRGVVVPQLYVGLPSRPSVPQPHKTLKGFRRMTLEAGESRRVRFGLQRRDLSYWDAGRDRWRLARGCARVFAGQSSERTPLHGWLAIGGVCASPGR